MKVLLDGLFDKTYFEILERFNLTKQDVDMFTQTMNEHFGTSFVSNGEVAYIESKYADF